MPIVVKHSGNVTPTAVGAYGAGMGQRQAEEGRLAMDRLFREREAAKARAAAAAEAGLSRAWSERQTREQRRWAADQDELRFKRDSQRLDDAEARRRSMADEESELRAGEREHESELRLREMDLSDEQARARAEDESRLRMGEAEYRRDLIDDAYTDRQRQEFNDLSNAYAEAERSEKFTKDELDEFRRNIIAKQAGIQPVPRMKKESPYPAGRDIGETWESDDGRFLMTRDDKGIPKKVGETNAAPTMQDIKGLYESGYKALMKRDAETNAEIPPDPEEVDAWVERAVNLHRRMAARAGQKPGGEVAPPETTPPPVDAGDELAAPPEWMQGVTDGPTLRAFRLNREAKRKEAGVPAPKPPKKMVLGPYAPGAKDPREFAVAQEEEGAPKSRFKQVVVNPQGETPKYQSKTDFVRAFMLAQKREPTARELKVALDRGIFTK